MRGPSRWWQRRRSTQGVSAGVGAIGGLILFVTVLTAGIGAAQLVRAHAALAQATQAAAQSEQQNGCWTSQTSHIVAKTLQGAGINPNTVKITADTGQSTTYGRPVTAGLATRVGVSVLGLPRIHIAMAAASNTTSFYTPSSSGGTNAACITPTMCTGTNGSTFVGCTGTGTGTYNVYSCGTLISSYTGIAPSGQCTTRTAQGPQITGVTFSGSGSHLKMTIDGSGFGSAPQSMPYTGDTSDFQFHDQTQGWEGGYTSNVVTTNYTSWGSDQIVIDGFAGQYGSPYVDHRGDAVRIRVMRHGHSASWTGHLPTDTIDVTSVSVSGSDVTVRGRHLPRLNDATSVYGGKDYGNFLWSAGSTPTTSAPADGNARYPYQPDWGIHVLKSSSTELRFAPANTPSSTTWYLYLVHSQHRIHRNTRAVWSGIP